MSSRRLQDMSSRHLQDMSSRRLQDVFSVTIFRLPRRLQDVLREVLKTSSRRLQDVLEDVKLLRWRRLETVFKTCVEDVFKTCSRLTNVCWTIIAILQIFWCFSCFLFNFRYKSSKIVFSKHIFESCNFYICKLLFKPAHSLSRPFFIALEYKFNWI